MEIIIDYEKCAPCPELKCVDTCPWGVFKVGSNEKPRVSDVASCTQCGICENLCPTKAIKVKRKDFSST